MRHLKALDACEVNPRATHLTALDFLKFWYYGGQCCCGLKDWARALECFRACICAPATVLSAVAVEAYKKMVLVGLLAHGAKPPLPNYCSSAVSKHLKTGCKAYADIAAMFEENNLAGLQAKVAAEADVLAADANGGLAAQVVAALTERRLSRLTSCYLTLSLEGVARQVGLGSAAEAQAALVRMVGKGTIAATVDQRTGMVRFATAGGGGGEPDEGVAAAEALRTAKRIEAATAAVVELNGRVEALDMALSKSPAYLKHAVGVTGGAGGAGRSSIMGPFLDDDGEDGFSDSIGMS